MMLCEKVIFCTYQKKKKKLDFLNRTNKFGTEKVSFNLFITYQKKKVPESFSLLSLRFGAGEET